MQLRDYRAEKGLTLHDVAAMVPWGFNKVSRHERGILEPKPSEVEIYRKITGNAVTHDDWVKLGKQSAKGARHSAASTPATEKALV